MRNAPRRASHTAVPARAYGQSENKSTDVTTAAHPLPGWHRVCERIAAVRPRISHYSSPRPAPMLPSEPGPVKDPTLRDTPNLRAAAAVTA